LLLESKKLNCRHTNTQKYKSRRDCDSERVAIDWAWLAKHKQNIHDNSLKDKKRERNNRKLWKATNKSYWNKYTTVYGSYNNKLDRL